MFPKNVIPKAKAARAGSGQAGSLIFSFCFAKLARSLGAHSLITSYTKGRQSVFHTAHFATGHLQTIR